MMRHDSAQQRAVTFRIGIAGAATMALCAIAALGGTAHAQWQNGPFALPGPNSGVGAMTMHDDGSGPALYVAGSFDAIDGQPFGHIARYSDGAWSALGTGLSGGVACLISFNGALIAGGQYTSAGGVPANNIARWNGTSWQAMGAGMNEPVRALAVFNGQLIAGGDFETADGQPAGRIAQWNGTGWQPLGSGTGTSGSSSGVRAMIEFQGSLIVAGQFPSAGGQPDSAHIARWDGANWHDIGAGLPSSGPTNANVNALAIYDDKLIVGGLFSTIGGNPASRIAQWDGKIWEALGAGVGSSVTSLLSHQGELIVGGQFTSAGGLPASAIAKWDGATWSSIDSGMHDGFLLPVVSVLAIRPTASGDELIVGGSFEGAEVVANNIVRRSASGVWSRLSECPTCMGLGGIGRAAVVHDDGRGESLFVGGRFDSAGNVRADKIARWDGQEWSALGSGFGPQMSTVHALATYDDGLGDGPQLYAGGSFSTADGQPASNIARWDGRQWHALFAPFDGPATILCMTVFDDGSGPALYIGGRFTSIGGQPARNLIKWNGLNWSEVGGGVTHTSPPPPPPLPATVETMAVYDDGQGPGLVIGGAFNYVGAENILSLARWRDGQWSSIGGNVGTSIYLATVGAVSPWPNETGPELVCQGQFFSAGGVPVYHIARWDGESWHDLSLQPNVNAPTGARMSLMHSGSGCAELYTQIGADWLRWNGAKWRPFGEDKTGVFWGFTISTSLFRPYLDFRMFEGKVYVVGSFLSVGGQLASSIAVWDIDASFACLGDMDGDDVVNINDLLAIINHWGTCANCPADSSPCGGDGQVNINDLLEVINQWGPCP